MAETLVIKEIPWIGFEPMTYRLEDVEILLARAFKPLLQFVRIYHLQ